MNNPYPFPIKLLLSTLTAMMLLSGCARSSDSAANDSSNPGADSGEASRTEYSNISSAMQADQETGSTSQDMPDTLPSGIPDPSPTDPGWQYSWQEITVTLPAEWKDLCVIQENPNGFSIFQKASYEEDKDGYICSFMRSAEYLNYGVGETLLAYTEDGQFYYLMQPTDFACASENREIMDEYSQMCDQVNNLAASLQITAGGIHYDAQEYVLPISSHLPLTQENLANLSDNELWIARNEIYARHGRRFTNEYLQLRFGSCTWYQGTIAPEQFDEGVLSQIERDNIQLLVAAEQEYDRQHPYPRQYAASETAMEDLSGNGTANRITYRVSRDPSLECELTIDGNSYDLYDLDLGDHWLTYPHTDTFYITDILESDNLLEIAILDLGDSLDLATHFFRYNGALSYIGTVDGWPFAELHSGFNGFDGSGRITGQTRTDLIETVYPEGYWRYDLTQDQIVCQETTWHSYFFLEAHTLYEDLPVHSRPDPASETTFIPADTEIFFLSTDLKEWILVKGKNGDMGYMQVANERIVDLDRPADEVISNLDFYD